MTSLHCKMYRNRMLQGQARAKFGQMLKCIKAVRIGFGYGSKRGKHYTMCPKTTCTFVPMGIPMVDGYLRSVGLICDCWVSGKPSDHTKFEEKLVSYEVIDSSYLGFGYTVRSANTSAWCKRWWEPMRKIQITWRKLMPRPTMGSETMADGGLR